MNGKNWLIRTKSYHLLGPVSKNKLLELIENGSITTDDEICSGSGYWFYVKETDLVQKYLYDNVAQDFNPVSEALNEKKQRSVTAQNNIKTNNSPIEELQEIEQIEDQFVEVQGSAFMPVAQNSQLEDTLQLEVESITKSEPLKMESSQLDSLKLNQEVFFKRNELPQSPVKVEQDRTQKIDLKSNMAEQITEIKEFKNEIKVKTTQKSNFYLIIMLVVVVLIAFLLVGSGRMFEFLLDQTHAQDEISQSSQKKNTLIK